jgi:hypothetical protein
MWFNKISKPLLILVIFPFALLLGNMKCFALDVTCQSSGCTLNPDNTPLFSESGVFPLWSSTKNITAKNLYPETRKFALEVKKATFSDSLPASLAEVLQVTVQEIESGITLYGPSKLSDVKDAGWILLSNIPSGAIRNYDITIRMDDVGNAYQNKHVRFDMSVGFDAVVPQEIDTPSHEDKDEDEDGGGGVGGGSGITSAVAGIATQLGFGGPAQNFEEVAGTSASATPELVFPKDDPAGNVKGASTCVDPKFWWVLFIVQFLLCFVFYKWSNKFVQILVDLVFILIFWKFFCPWWDVLASALIGVFWLLLLRRKLLK